MMVRGTVVSRHHRTARVRVCHGEFCAGCGHHSPGEQQVEVDVLDPLGVTAGQRVEFTNDSWRMLRVMVLVFWVPLLAAGLGAALGDALAARMGWSATPAMVAGAVLLLAAAAGAVVVAGRRTPAGAGLTITRIIPDGETCTNRSI